MENEYLMQKQANYPTYLLFMLFFVDFNENLSHFFDAYEFKY